MDKNKERKQEREKKYVDCLKLKGNEKKEEEKENEDEGHIKD